MKKLLFGAFVLPVVVASCTQDALVNDVTPSNGAPNAEGFMVELNAQKGDVEGTRVFNPATGTITFEGTDQINMFWLTATAPTAATNYNQKFNSIFNIEQNAEDGGSTFRSKSLVYKGYNVATYPGQLTTAEGDIELKVYNTKDGIKQMPYISNLIDMGCTNNKVQHNQGSGNLQAGFNNKLRLPMKMAANYADLKVEFTNIATGIEGYDKLELQNVTFNTVGGSPKFATEANIQTFGTAVPTNNGEWKYTVSGAEKKVQPIVAQTYAVAKAATASNALATTDFEIVSNKNTEKTTTATVYAQNFPTQDWVGATKDPNSGINRNDGNTIVLETNMGIVTIKSTNTGTLGNPDYVETTPLYTQKNDGTKNAKTGLEAFFNLLTSRRTNANGNFKNEVVGKWIARTLVVDMREAVITGSVVKNSAEIIRYVNLYNALGKSDNLELKLHATAFEGLNQAALTKLNSNTKFTLNLNGNTSIKLLDGDNVTTSTLPATAKFSAVPGTLTFELAAGKNWTLDQAANLPAAYSIKNSGTLTITNTANKGTNEPLSTAVENAGTLNISGNVTANTVNVALGAVVNIPAENKLNLKSGSTVTGTVHVNGELMIYAGTTNIAAKGVVNNNGFVACLNGASAKINNAGTINVGENNQQTLITSNLGGTINLYKRNDQVSVGNAGEQGVIAIRTSQLATPNEYKFVADDKMNKLIVDAGNITMTTLPSATGIKYMEIATTCKIFANMNAVNALVELTVDANKTLTIDTNNEVDVTGTTKIHDGAKIIVAGTLKYGTCAESSSSIFTTGSSASVSAS